MKKITVTVQNDGSVEVETSGFKGRLCLEESQFVKDLLGHETAVQLCPAFYQKDNETVKRYLPICG
jgi:hypothetical protein